MNFIMENKGMITVETGKQVIEFSAPDFADFFNDRNNCEYWQFPTKWKQKNPPPLFQEKPFITLASKPWRILSGNVPTSARLKTRIKSGVLLLIN